MSQKTKVITTVVVTDYPATESFLEVSQQHPEYEKIKLLIILGAKGQITPEGLAKNGVSWDDIVLDADQKEVEGGYYVTAEQQAYISDLYNLPIDVINL